MLDQLCSIHTASVSDPDILVGIILKKNLESGSEILPKSVIFFNDIWNNDFKKEEYVE